MSGWDKKSFMTPTLSATFNLMSKAILITGLSSGIAYEPAKLFGKGGYGLVLVERNRERLLEMKREFEKR